MHLNPFNILSPTMVLIVDSITKIYIVLVVLIETYDLDEVDVLVLYNDHIDHMYCMLVDIVVIDVDYHHFLDHKNHIIMMLKTYMMTFLNSVQILEM